MDPSYIDSFGNPMQQTSAIDFDGKKKKRSIVIGVIAVMIIILVVVLVVFLGSGGIKNGLDNKQKYLNYLVNGDVSNSENVGTEYSDMRNYYFTDAIYLDEIGVSYFDELIKLLNNIDADKSSINYREQVAMLGMFRSYKVISKISLSDVVNDEGEELMISVENLDNVNVFLSTYKNNAIPYLEGLSQLAKIGVSIGCNANIPETECVATDEMQNISDNNLTLFGNIEQDIKMAMSYYLNAAYTLGAEK